MQVQHLAPPVIQPIISPLYQHYLQLQINAILDGTSLSTKLQITTQLQKSVLELTIAESSIRIYGVPCAQITMP